MDIYEQYFSRAEAFKRVRAQAAKELDAVEVRYNQEKQKLSEKHRSTLVSNDSWFARENQRLISEASSRRQSYLDTRMLLDQYPGHVAQFCGELPRMDYSPNPEKIDEQILSDLMEKISKDGFIAWIKRTFRLGGYRSRKEMAITLCEHVMDAQAYCDIQIDRVNSDLDIARQKLSVESRRRKKAIEDEELKDLQALTAKKEDWLRQARQKLDSCSASADLAQFTAELLQQQELARQTYGGWGNYAPPNKSPDKLLLGNITLRLIDSNGIEHPQPVPCWLPLQKSSIVVLTSNSSERNGNPANSVRKQFIRQMLARMLKSVPYTQNRVSVFDTLHKGGSLDRLIGISNVGGAKLSVDVYFEEDACHRRRNYLCEQISHIRKLLEGRCDLYTYQAQNNHENEMPLHWIVEFDMPDKLRENILEHYKILFTNAAYCGYSFVFETSNAGLANIQALAAACGHSNIIHIDLDAMLYQNRYPFCLAKEPMSEQLDNFMDAISKYFEGSDHLDNRLLTYYKNHAKPISNAADGVKIPVALDHQGKPVFLELSNSTSVHAFITGATRSGKSTLLHSVIMGATLQYSPDDLELWLVDYKQVEFAIYRTLRPPHVKLIGLSKTKDFTYSLLDKLKEEFNRRSEQFTRFHVQTLGDYRKHAGEPGYIPFPRILLIIDEFHEMSQFVQEEESYKIVLENALAEYGAMGLNCFLSDQAISVGLQGLTPKAKMQIGMRLSMRHNDTTEVRDTLNVDASMYSEAVKQMIQRMVSGDVIMKRYTYIGGTIADVSLEKFRAFRSSQEDREALYPVLNEYYKGKHTPKDLLYVCSKEQVPWEEEYRILCDRDQPLRERDLRLYLGLPTTLQPCFAVDLQRSPDQNLCVLGGTVEQRWDVIAAAINSCRYKPNTAVKVFVAESSNFADSIGRKITELCVKLPNAELFVSTQQWCEELARLEEAINSKVYQHDYLCVFIGMDVMALEMEYLPERKTSQPFSPAPSFSAPSFSAPSFAVPFQTPFGGSGFAAVPTPEPEPEEEALEFNALPMIQSLFTLGSRLGMHCVLEASVFRELTRVFRSKIPCTHRIAFTISEDDAGNYFERGSFAKRIGKFAVYHRGVGDIKQLIPYLSD